MLATRVSGIGLLWLGLSAAYLAASALGERAAALAVLGLMAGALVAASGHRVLAFLTGVALAGAAWRYAEEVRFLVFVPPLAAFAFMAFFFGRTLRAGSEPLINRIARKEHGDLPADVARHTRLLTGVWTACFIALFVVALALAPVLSLESWSRWVQGLGYVVPGALFLGEYAYRHHRFPNRPHGALVVLVRNVIVVLGEIARETDSARGTGERGAMSALALAGYRAPGDAVLLGASGAVSAASFFAQAARLARALPDGEHVINLCETRHGFMLGFAAALLRGQVSLLPPGRGRAEWEALLRRHPGAHVLSEKPLEGADTFAFGEMLEERMEGAFEIPRIDSACVAAILFTSGSTGEPTAHPKTWGRLCAGARLFASRLGWDERPTAAIVGSVRPQHMFGLESTVMLPWQAGVPVHSRDPLLAADLETALAECGRPAWWLTTPMLLRAPIQWALPGLQGVVASTRSLPAELARAAESAWRVPVIELYGSTETGALATRRTASEVAWTPMPGVTLRVEGVGEAQRFIAVGPHIDPPVVLGDIFDLHPDGRFEWLGRSSDLVKVGGKRASLFALNLALTGIAGVDDGVVAFPPESGAASDETHPARRLADFFVSEKLGPRQVLAALRERVDPAFLPRPIHRVERLPRDANGKLTQAALAGLFAQFPFVQAIAAGHPALPGHFPGAPLVPGVTLLARVADALRMRFPQCAPGELRHARFQSALRPGEAFVIEARQEEQGCARFEVRRAAADGAPGAVIASGEWALQSAGTGTPRA